MNITMKTLSALTLAAAALAATVGSSSALSRGQLLNELHNSGALKAIGTLQPKAPPFHVPPYLGNGGGHGIVCLACNLPRPEPKPMPTHGHDWGHGYGWGPRTCTVAGSSSS